MLTFTPKDADIAQEQAITSLHTDLVQFLESLKADDYAKNLYFPTDKNHRVIREAIQLTEKDIPSYDETGLRVQLKHNEEKDHIEITISTDKLLGAITMMFV